MCWGLAGGSCRQIIGIERADVDPALSAGGPSSAAGAPSALGAGADSGGSSSAGAATGAVGNEGGASAGNASAGGEASLELRGAGGDAAGAAGAGGSADRGPSLCERYCEVVVGRCTGAFAVYPSSSACLAVCQALPEGKPGDRTGNSVQCRLRAAELAADELSHYCPIAGPGGNGVCGHNCESLCQLSQVVCDDYVDQDGGACLTKCAKLRDLGSYSTDLSKGQSEGAHVQCRLYHVAAAAADDPEPHCSAVDGAPPCR
jgi:hypothetical protein